jgi:hypothetical protein
MRACTYTFIIMHTPSFSRSMSFYPSALQVQNSKTWVKQDNLIKPMVQTLARGVDRTKMVPMADHFTETGAKSFF